jgi:hypothetical protein
MAVVTYNSDLGDAWEWLDDPEYPASVTTLSYREGNRFSSCIPCLTNFPFTGSVAFSPLALSPHEEICDLLPALPCARIGDRFFSSSAASCRTMPSLW